MVRAHRLAFLYICAILPALFYLGRKKNMSKKTFLVNGKPFEIDNFEGPTGVERWQAERRHRANAGLQSGADFGGVKSPRMMKHRPAYEGVRVK